MKANHMTTYNEKLKQLGYVATVDKLATLWDNYGFPGREIGYSRVYVALFIPKTSIVKD